MQRFYTLLFYISMSLLAITGVVAQSNFVITGTVKDQQGNPLRQASVSLLRAKDSSIVKAEVSNENGRYELSAAAEQAYLLLFTMVGYENNYTSQFKLEADRTTDVSLQTATRILNDVSVTARKPMIEIKADKTIFNVEGSINATGSNALELLQKSPGMRVDNNDNISMKGKNGVRIYIDGKPSQLDVKDLAAYLRSINSNDIEAIEMISNPSAKYDASGNAGIVNIRLKKNKKYGTNGSVNAGLVQGVTPKGNGSFNLNYRDKLVNLFGNVGTNIGNYQNTIDLYRIQSDTLFDQKSKSVSNNKNYNAKAGADYFINSRNTIGFIVNGNISSSDWANDSRTSVSDATSKQFVKTLDATNSVNGNRVNFNSNVNYRYADTSGKEINVDADYGLFRGTGRSYQPNHYRDAKGDILYSVINRNNTPTDIDIYTIKADVEMNKWKGKLGYGAKGSYVKTQNAFELFTDRSGTPVKDLQRSNRFKYIENVNAAYVNFNRSLGKKFSLQAGLRAEQTNSEGVLKRDDNVVQDDNNIKRHYFNLFPSGALTYNVNSKNTLNITFSRRIDRPSYQDLNPFENKLDELTFEKGNAFLKPQYTNNIELSHTFRSLITSSVGYSHVKDYRAQFIDTANKNATYVQQRNLASQKIYSFNVGSSLPLAKWWSGYVNVYGNYQKFDGEFTNQKIDLSVFGYGGYFQSAFKLGHDYTAEVSGWFNGPGLDGTIRAKAMGAADIGVQKLFMDKKATVKLSVTDVFRTARWGGITNANGLYAKLGGTWESQTIRLNFTYRFGSNQISSARQRKTGLDNEANRIKGGK
ncbi:TonB-dependent receptor [Segetibacter sp. 3557_3]|uniref:TonB-dependent receptor n=1 Tax=Segetibacter sp. 3557_3 TaxID=2547429 RepID=UPI0010589269|nr:TonB-dependent receptor [Segetibacter sp. 3557_3]TDH23224.1 TonB-dependent receptor [Segetibacter sp. 3557_3]